ncbi:MAG: hypothetical protein H6555_03485 [Lewinellaceae bacterium]|nr:hypothetical protein [Lewinellaceae bacterium]
MKNLLIVLLLITPLLSFGQEFPESIKTMSQGSKNCFTVMVPGLDAKETEKVWDNYLKGFKSKKPKKDRKTSEIFTDDVMIPTLSANTIDLYTSVKELGQDGSQVDIWFDLGGAYLNGYSHGDKMGAVQTWLADFQRMTRTRVVEIELEGEEGKLSDLNKDYSKLQKDQEKIEKEIADYEQKLQDARKALADTKTAQQTRQAEIQQQERAVEQVREKLKKVN